LFSFPFSDGCPLTKQLGEYLINKGYDVALQTREHSMISKGPESEKKEGSRILRRVQSLMTLDIFTANQPPAPPPVAASKQELAVSKSDKKEKKHKKDKKVHKDKTEKKEKKSGSSALNRLSRQLFSSRSDELDDLELEMLSNPLSAPSSPTAHSGPTSLNRGSVLYTTHDKFKIHSGDLARYPVTICTRDERMAQIDMETRQRSQSTASASVAKLPPMPLELQTESPPPPPVLPSRGSVILNTSIPLSGSMKLLQEAVASIALTDEKTKNDKPAP